MTYNIEISSLALEDIKSYHKSGDRSAYKKIKRYLEEISEHPYTGTGKPEALKYNFSGQWSRRINKKERLIYKVLEEEKRVLILSARGHYV